MSVKVHLVTTSADGQSVSPITMCHRNRHTVSRILCLSQYDAARMTLLTARSMYAVPADEWCDGCLGMAAEFNEAYLSMYGDRYWTRSAQDNMAFFASNYQD